MPVSQVRQETKIQIRPLTIALQLVENKKQEIERLKEDVRVARGNYAMLLHDYNNKTREIEQLKKGIRDLVQPQWRL